MTPQVTEHDRIVALGERMTPFTASGDRKSEIVPFAYGADGRVLLVPGTKNGVVTLEEFQLFLGRDAWRRSDSLPGSSDMIRIGVYFLDGESFQHDYVARHCAEWTTGAGASNVEFVVGNQDRHHIRITFLTSRNESMIGRQATRERDKTQPTMWLGDVRREKSKERILQVIRHEFGHALGLRHEHQHPEGGIRWNRSVVIAELARNGWDAATVERNIFDAYTSTSYLCRGSEGFDATSIMLYPIPAAWTENGFSTERNTRISAADLRCVSRMYA